MQAQRLQLLFVLGVLGVQLFSMACVLYELLTDLSAFVRTADRYAGELSFDQLRQLVLWRQGQWDADSAQGRVLPYGLAALVDSIPDDEDCWQAADLLQRMLTMEPSQRPSAQEALLDPFLRV